jgi:hypothetical protein
VAAALEAAQDAERGHRLLDELPEIVPGSYR